MVENKMRKRFLNLSITIYSAMFLLCVIYIILPDRTNISVLNEIFSNVYNLTIYKIQFVDVPCESCRYKYGIFYVAYIAICLFGMIWGYIISRGRFKILPAEVRKFCALMLVLVVVFSLLGFPEKGTGIAGILAQRWMDVLVTCFVTPSMILAIYF
jgi:hypothetical protein